MSPSIVINEFPTVQLGIVAALWRASTTLLAGSRTKCAAAYGLSGVALFVYSHLLRNAFESLLSRASFGLLGTPRFTVGGTCAPGFERIRTILRAQFRQGMHRSAQFAVYVAGRKVVDVFGSVRGCGLERSNPVDPDPRASTFHGRAPSAPDYTGAAYDSDSMQIMFSSTKSLAALVVALLVERGQLAYDASVAKVWPEFAQHGKGAITLSDVLRHESGLAFLDKPLTFDMMAPAAVARNEIGAHFEAQEPLGWDTPTPEYPNILSTRCYHGITRGLVLNEIVRRADPAGRTIGVILRDDICAPLDLRRIHIGTLPLEQESFVAPLGMQSVASTVCDAVALRLGLKAARDPRSEQAASVRATLMRMKQLYKTSHLLRWFSSLPGHTSYEDGEAQPRPADAVLNNNKRKVHCVESPSTNGLCSARDLAKLAGCLANGGELDGVRVISTRTLRDAESGGTRKFDTGTHGWSTFSKGGWCRFDDDETWLPIARGFVGWGGLGGSVFSWSPARNVGVAFAHNAPYRRSPMGWKDAQRCLPLIEATLAIIDGGGWAPAAAL
jgi:CubicO group peptidase (beta-lactamase class C family)